MIARRQCRLRDADSRSKVPTLTLLKTWQRRPAVADRFSPLLHPGEYLVEYEGRSAAASCSGAFRARERLGRGSGAPVLATRFGSEVKRTTDFGEAPAMEFQAGYVPSGDAGLAVRLWFVHHHGSLSAIVGTEYDSARAQSWGESLGE